MGTRLHPLENHFTRCQKQQKLSLPPPSSPFPILALRGGKKERPLLRTILKGREVRAGRKGRFLQEQSVLCVILNHI